MSFKQQEYFQSEILSTKMSNAKNALFPVARDLILLLLKHKWEYKALKV